MAFLRKTAVLLITVMFSISVSAATGIATSNVNMRVGPSTFDTIIMLVEGGESVEVVEDMGGWYKVKYKNKTGYIIADFLNVKGTIAANAEAAAGGALKPGMEGESVKNLQVLLTQAGYYSGPQNGKYGPLTESTVKTFQADRGLTVDGIAGNGTITSLKSYIDNQTKKSSPQTTEIVTSSVSNFVRKGDNGEKVYTMQKRLFELGFLASEPDSNFGNQTEVALVAFQNANGLLADGICGENTMTRLNSADAVTALAIGYDAESAPKSLVDLTPWSEAKKIFTIGVAARVYDCYTGITYYVKSFSNGSHADVEPVTKEDTALLKQTYGGTWSWDPRPVWVTINGHTMAASINGMPHGGGVNNDNGMDGQVCIHFKGSTTHNGNTSFAQRHQNAAVEAYNLANN